MSYTTLQDIPYGQPTVEDELDSLTVEAESKHRFYIVLHHPCTGDEVGVELTCGSERFTDVLLDIDIDRAEQDLNGYILSESILLNGR
jgi:hypothetical protein